MVTRKQLQDHIIDNIIDYIVYLSDPEVDVNFYFNNGEYMW